MVSDENPGTRRPPLNLTREAYGYLVIAAGVALTVLVLGALPAAVPSGRLPRFLLAFVLAVITAFVYQYVTNSWYEQFE